MISQAAIIFTSQDRTRLINLFGRSHNNSCILLLSYNDKVPTPFYHLSIAAELVGSQALPTPIRTLLEEQRCAFFFGKTAPDVQTISGQPRAETHFYRIPLVETTPPWERMFQRYPGLAQAQALPPAQAAFIAGYICHLQADVIWIRELFLPYFLPLLAKLRRKQVGYLHNVLRSFLDERILHALQQDVGQCLMNVQADGWLPFVEGKYIIKWRNFIASQLMPGAKTRTVEVFAERMNMPADALLELLHSESRMETEIFSFIPYQVLVEYRQKLIASNLQLLGDYFNQMSA